MPSNIEIKARLDDTATTEARARALCGAPTAQLDQRDTFYPCAEGRLKLRVIAAQAGGHAAGDVRGELIHYLRADCNGPRRSDYQIAAVARPDELRAVLDAACGALLTVRKRRHLYLHGRTRIHIDRVESLGDFVELEVVLKPGEDPAAGDAEAQSLMAELGIADHQLVAGAYADLLAVDGKGVARAPATDGRN